MPCGRTWLSRHCPCCSLNLYLLREPCGVSSTTLTRPESRSTAGSYLTGVAIPTPPFQGARVSANKRCVAQRIPLDGWVRGPLLGPGHVPTRPGHRSLATGSCRLSFAASSSNPHATRVGSVWISSEPAAPAAGSPAAGALRESNYRVSRCRRVHVVLLRDPFELFHPQWHKPASLRSNRLPIG